jgi:hypothetical protein
MGMFTLLRRVETTQGKAVIFNNHTAITLTLLSAHVCKVLFLLTPLETNDFLIF